MGGKASMTLSLSEAEMGAVDEMATKKGVSKTALIRQALRLYQLLDGKLSDGYRMKLVNPSTGQEDPPLVVVGCGWPGMD